MVDILRLKLIHKLLNEDGLNITGIKTLRALIPCLAIRQCSDEERENCQAFHSDAYPCWEASEKMPCWLERSLQKFSSFSASVLPSHLQLSRLPK
jgi:hypothetical protein